MRAYQEQDFDKMAARVVDRFMGGDKLADVAALEAQQGQLNPDQIARLVQAANTMAFLRLMEQQKQQGVPDMTGEFDPIDPRQVIQQIVGGVQLPHEGGGEAPHAEPDGDEGPLPDEMSGAHRARCVDAPGEGGASPHDSMCVDAEGGGAEPGETNVHMHGDEPDVHVHNAPEADDDNDGPFPKGEKQKAKDDAAKKDKPKKGPPKEPGKDQAKEAAFRDDRMRKFAGVLEDQYKQAEWAFEDAFKDLDDALRQAWGGPTWDAFEKDAMALAAGGEVGIAVLDNVRQSRRLSPLDRADAREKSAALVDRHVVSDGPATRAFERMVRIAEEAERLRRGAEHVRALCS